MPDPFITETDLADYLGRDLSDNDAAVIVVDSACDMVRTLTEQDFNSASDTVSLDGSGTDTLLLPQVPVSAVSEVIANGVTLAGTIDYAFTAQGHLLRTGGTASWTTWGQTAAPLTFWPQGRQNVTVTYTHGYADDDLPRDIRQVALMIASRLIVQDVKQFEAFGQANVRYAVASTDLTNGEKAILAKYRQAK